MKKQDFDDCIKKPCLCGSNKFRRMIGAFSNSDEIVCAECGRTAEYLTRRGEGGGDYDMRTI